MLVLLVILLVLTVVLTALFWLGSLSLQGYFYTEPSQGLMWQAPVAAVAIALYLLFWSLLNSWYAEPGSKAVPFGVVWEFDNRVSVIADPVPQFESKYKTTGAAIFKLEKLSEGNKYKKVDSNEYWNGRTVEYVKFNYKGTDYNFVPDKTRDTEYIVLVDANSGLEMKSIDMGRVEYGSASRVLIYLLLNVVHLLLWIVCFWLVLRFELSHAVGLGGVMWLLFTAAIFPALFARQGG